VPSRCRSTSPRFWCAFQVRLASRAPATASSPRSLHQTPSTKLPTWPRPPLPPPLFPPDYKGETRPRYPGGWGSGSGLSPGVQSTLQSPRRGGGRGQAFHALSRFHLPSQLPSRMPRRVPSLTSTLEGMRGGSPEGPAFRDQFPSPCGQPRLRGESLLWPA
jgi:hypothetical protein